MEPSESPDGASESASEALEAGTTGFVIEGFPNSIVEAAIAAASKAASTGFNSRGSEGKSASDRTAGSIPESTGSESLEENSEG